MYVLIDMSVFDAIHLALFDESFRIDEVYEGRNRELLKCIDMFLVSAMVETSPAVTPPSSSPSTSPTRRGDSRGFEDVRGIMVVVGAGSFTSTRIAVVVANTFAYVRQIPLLAIGEEQIDHAQDLIPELLKQKPGQYISATYSGEPNIGKSKKGKV